MFTEKDYAEYFRDMQAAEKQMIDNMDKILSDISDEEVRTVLSGIRKDEFRHLKMEDELFKMLESSDIKL